MSRIIGLAPKFNMIGLVCSKPNLAELLSTNLKINTPGLLSEEMRRHYRRWEQDITNESKKYTFIRIQLALVICGLFIRGFTYPWSMKIYQNLVFAAFWLQLSRLFGT